jgi:hypothetical protein
MKLEKIISLANEPVRLRFLGMERSLRASGCDLPLWVIPYDDRRFKLPKNSNWWTVDPVKQWLDSERSHTIMSKYQCLLEGNYQFVDADVIFLKDPSKALAAQKGFITSCTHWNNTDHTITDESFKVLKAKTTTWQRGIFNSGQFASDQALYTFEELKRVCLEPQHDRTCLRLTYEQPAIVLLANLSGVPIHNMTLPPTCMESSWAGDYVEEGYEKRYWTNESRKPYLIHWAGCHMWEPRAIDPLFTEFLTKAELKEWNEEVAAKKLKDSQFRRSVRSRLRRTARGVKAFTREVKK